MRGACGSGASVCRLTTCGQAAALNLLRRSCRCRDCALRDRCCTSSECGSCGEGVLLLCDELHEL
jgi:hypothetical protein